MPPPTSCSLLLPLALVVVLAFAFAAGAGARCPVPAGGGVGVLGGKPLKPDVVVAKPGGGGGGDVTTIADALMRSNGTRNTPGYFVIYITEGVYEEHVVVAIKNVVLIGDGWEKTIITGNRSNKTKHDVHESATLTARAEGFMARDLCIRNTAGMPDDRQAVAFFSESDRSVLYKCDIQGYQDTLLANVNRQFYRQCRIWGTVDFIFGNAAAVFQDCELYARQPADHGQHDVITAQGREEHAGSSSGFVFQGCTVAPSTLPGEGLTTGVQTYLGRPWRHHAMVVFMGCSIDNIVHADGWVSWSKDKQAGGKDPTPGHQNHTYFAEYNNHVRGSAHKVHWRGFKAISSKEARRFTPRHFISGDDWIPQTGVPYHCGL